MRVRRAEAKDSAAILELLSTVLALHAGLRPDLFIPGTRKYSAQALEAILAAPDKAVFVAADEADAVLGYCFCELRERRGLPNMYDGRELYIDDLCVAERARGLGIGRALCAQAFAYAKERGCSSVSLNVWAGNEAALAFYERQGFFVQKTRLEKRI